jgi:hypothetical protein
MQHFRLAVTHRNMEFSARNHRRAGWRAFLVAVTVAIFSRFCSAESNVVALNTMGVTAPPSPVSPLHGPSELQSATSEELAFVKFFSPRCRHCKAMASAFVEMVCSQHHPSSFLPVLCVLSSGCYVAD